MDAGGRIGGETKAYIQAVNYINRVNIGAKSRILGSPVSNVSMALYDSSGQLIRSWTSSGSPETFENLPEGSYYVIADGDQSRQYAFYFAGDEALQEVSVTIWTMEDAVAIALGALSRTASVRRGGLGPAEEKKEKNREAEELKRGMDCEK